jgi:hypothetical protein
MMQDGLEHQIRRTNQAAERYKPLATLRDAALYIAKLPKAENTADEWQAAMEALILNGLTMFARIGVMRALNRHVERLFNSSRKPIASAG